MSAQAIQFMTPVKRNTGHSFELNLKELQNIFNINGMNERNAVVVSIAGAFRKGKSFLLNFFLKYLYAQVIYQCRVFQLIINET